MTKSTELVSKILASSDGTEVFAQYVGDPTKPHLVFVHGFNLSGSVFDKIFLDEKYQEEYFLVRYDARGHGRSGKPDLMEGYTPELYANDFKAVYDAFNLHKPIYVGWSLGGTPAADIVACLPEDTLSAIVYIASFYGTEFIPQFLSPFSLEHVPILLSPTAATADVKDAAMRFSDSIFDWFSDCHPYSPSDARLRHVQRWDIQSSWLGYGAHMGAIQRCCVATRKQDTQPLFDLGKKRFPVLIVHGTQDAIVLGDKFVGEGKKRFTNLTVAWIEEGGSHAPFYENPNLVMKHIGSFVKEVQTRSQPN